MNLFDRVKSAPPDPILGMTEAFNQDPNPNKVNLSVGVYQDGSGRSPVLNCVREAESRLSLQKRAKSYLPIQGERQFIGSVQGLVFGESNEMVMTGRLVTLQTPGGTGALRLAAEFIRRQLGQRKVWVSNPTWGNHLGIFAAADLETCYYPYYDAAIKGLNLSGMLSVLETIPENDVVLFHASCHNPTGVDPGADDWNTIAKICKARNLLPVLDFAYQGFAEGIVTDAVAVRAFAAYGLEFFVCSSFSKNFGLYSERIGALHVVAKNADEASRVLSQIKAIIRVFYSNPPAHGAAIISTILSDLDLRLMWDEELRAMRDRIRGMRTALVKGLAAAGVRQDFGFIEHQRGMFSFSGLPHKAVVALRQQHGIYMIENGRINVAGLNAGNMDLVSRAIAGVL